MCDYYKVLGIPRDAAQMEIKKSYHMLVRKYHPDCNNDRLNAFYQDKMVLINEAYEILSDLEKRTLYDISWNNMIKGNNKFKKLFSFFRK